MPNRLAQEKSPYLRQHGDNPVDWYPWGEEAFAKARTGQKPIFLSIGYSTCHWCHVMAHESFENPEIAALLNADFVAIKVDREERPDVDRVYMTYVQAMTGSGGWPMSVWLTPELKPFFGGTYFPPEGRSNRPGFASVLLALARGWAEQRAQLVAEGQRVIETLRQHFAESSERPLLSSQSLADDAATARENCFQHLAATFDPVRGGFGGAPKFPRASNLAFLFRCAVRQGVDRATGRQAVQMATFTLHQMARGGIHDHVGGGFHRYSVDADWFVPHFEKMLYDQAQIALNALEAWQATHDEQHAGLARDICDYVLRDLAHPSGGFYAAEDADSAIAAGQARHAEGAFYVWHSDELRALLGADHDLFSAHFGVQENGNVAAGRDPSGEFAGQNILAQTQSLAETAARFGLTPGQAAERLAQILARLRTVRDRRPRPHRDDKILTAWNGLMLSALARAAVVPAAALADRSVAYRAAAEQTADFLQRELFDPARDVLFRSWCEGRGAAEGFAEDYAYLIQGLLDLYEATFAGRWLQWAVQLQAKMDELFLDPAHGGYFNSAAGAADVILRLKEDYDGAEPAPGSVAAMNLLRLAGLLGRDDWRTQAVATIEALRAQWSGAPHALPQMLCAVDFALAALQQVVLAGDPAAADFRALAAVLYERLAPPRVVLAATGGETQPWLASHAPWLAAIKPHEACAVAYLCESYRCRLPAMTPEELRSALT
jgi:uncharacterized protein YyaL (SSP411 family)